MTKILAQVTLSELGTFFGGLAVFIGTLWTIALHIMLKRQTKFHESVAASMLGMAKKAIEEQIAGRDPKSYHSHDIEFYGGSLPNVHLNAPMIPDVPLTVAENLTICVVHHSTECTTLAMRTSGIATLPKHRHHRASETITVIEGTMTDIRTNRIYEAGDTWHIEMMEWHGATFSPGFFGLVTCKPPLPTAAESPPKLEGMEKAFLSNPPPVKP